MKDSTPKTNSKDREDSKKEHHKDEDVKKLIKGVEQSVEEDFHTRQS